MNLPDYNFLSAPLWLITVLHLVTLTLHFVAMNFLVGGIMVILFGRFKDRWNNPTVQRFIKLFPNAMAATVTLGVAPLLFVQLVFHRQTYAASIVSAWLWLGIVAAAIAAYYLLYGASFTKKLTDGCRGHYLAWSLVGLVYISFVYTTVFSMAERPDLYMSVYAATQSGLGINPDIGGWIFRWLHMLTGALTVGAFFVGWLGKDDVAAFKIGKGFYLWGMVIAMVIGLAYLFSMGDHILPFMRSSAVWWLLVAILLSLGSLHFYFKKKFIPAALMLFVSLLSMVIIRYVVRLIQLVDATAPFEPTSLPVKPQWGIFLIFLVFFLVAVGVVWYMLRLFFKAKQQAA